jgi:hypothetical protein
MIFIIVAFLRCMRVLKIEFECVTDVFEILCMLLSALYAAFELDFKVDLKTSSKLY